MIWVTWRQHRAQILLTAAFLAALGLLLLGSAIEATLYVSGHAPPGCPGTAPACAPLEVALGERYDAVYSIFGWMPLVLPALIGAFWGAPLLGREYERGTTGWPGPSRCRCGAGWRSSWPCSAGRWWPAGCCCR